ncbi:uncharacterized protein LOC127420714 isoform X2 [Myxocyprinus asiaticus]|nr:uncharacterized protein LOC127420714 isoform X2 [Myxocyprinus asiaticus]
MGSSTPINESPPPQTSTPVKRCPAKYTTPEKVVKLSFLEYVLHTDTELEQVRKQYFELAKKGEERNCQMSKDLRCRLIRNTMTSMIAILRATGDGDRYPSKPEITAMAKRIVLYYPMLQDRDLNNKNTWVTVYSQLYKRLQNVRSPQKTIPDGRHSKRRRLEQPGDPDEFDSSDSTIILDCSSQGSSNQDCSSQGSSTPDSGSNGRPNKPTDIDTPDTDSPATMAKHYRTLQALCKKKNPNHESVSQLLDLEFAARRAFIDSDSVREEDRYEKILEAYPCFKDIGHVMGELRRILDKDNSHYIDELRGRWDNFCQKVQFFGVWKKMLKPPMGMDKVEQALGILRVLPSLFPSSSTPPKKIRDASEALVHVLEENEEPNAYLKKRPLSCPVLIVSSSNCLLAVGDVPITTFPKDKVTEGALYLMAYYYALHLTYPKCVATLLSVIQTEVLLDTIHEQDLTPSFKKGMADWKAFVGK